jgi:hypothetical protein
MEVAVAKVKYYPDIFFEGERKTTKGLGIIMSRPR